jgi:hypothetical protein
MSRNRLRDPEIAHEEFLAGEMDAARVVDLQRRQTEETVFRGRHHVPVISGQWATGDAQQSAMKALVDLGPVVDETELGDLAEDTAYGTKPTITLAAAAGATATGSVDFGNDTDFTVTVVPSGAGIATGTIFSVRFAVDRANSIYAVHMSPASSAARTLGGVVGRTSRTASVVDIATATALTSGSTYIWDVLIREQEY